MTELEGDKPLLLAVAHARNEGRKHARPGSPGKMKPGRRIAVTGGVAAAALRPTDYGKKPQAALAQPRPFLPGRESHIGLRPTARPMVFFAIEGGAAKPILQRERVRVADAHTALLEPVDQKQPTERPEGLSAQRLLRLLIENDDGLACVDQFGRRDQSGQSSSDNDCVGVIGHARLQASRDYPLTC